MEGSSKQEAIETEVSIASFEKILN